ncbi:alpha/beta hydrolase [Diaminobutyricibacter tongyongensis]|uniref:Alpha/beta hydrolase n=1 Tax=Leifsonia tongyongensis TaxID=1268043 RepID=A0A6L9XWT7_9MICO|nr:alpha/beta hydrolase [Diaminobutyricibacter tongyongensis]NEN05746.1 alpha/beta hydrolase [Diaminobutyricibacter tongyongensis]
MNIIDITTEAGTAEVTYAEFGQGRPVVILHGGAGPQSVTAFAELFAARGDSRVIVPTHPGFAGTPRPDHLDSIRALAELYATMIDELDLTDVLLIGNSIGGWIAAELALIAGPRLSALILVDAAGLDVDGHPIADFFSLTMDQLADLSYFEPGAYRIDVDALPAPVKSAMAGNRAALLAYAGTSMADPTLRMRIAGIRIPTLVVWGQADRVVDPAHARAYATGIPGAALDLIDNAGHLPQLETPERLRDDVAAFVAGYQSALPATSRTPM